MLLVGTNIMVSGQEMPLLSLQPIQDGCILQLTRFHSTMSCQDLKDNSQEILIHLVMTKVLSITGCTRVTTKTLGCYHKRCGDGSNGKMVLMCSLLTNQKLDGTIFLTVDSTLNRTQDKVSITQSMSITTISILMLMLNQGQQEVLKVLQLVNSYPRVNSMTKTDGEKTN